MAPSYFMKARNPQRLWIHGKTDSGCIFPIPQIGAPTEETEAEKSGWERQGTDHIVPQPDHGLAILVTVLVVLVVLATAGLLVILRKRQAWFTGKRKAV